MFFPIAPSNDERGIELDLSRPFLMGWQTARYDDQFEKQVSEGIHVRRKYPFLAQDFPYIHPSRPALRFIS